MEEDGSRTTMSDKNALGGTQELEHVVVPEVITTATKGVVVTKDAATSDTSAQALGTSKPPNRVRYKSIAWKHFNEPIIDGEGKQVTTCKHCAKSYVCNIRDRGTSSLLQHMRKCTKNPDNKQANRQKLLTFTRVDNIDQVSAWSFDQKACREALAKMIIIDELPFRFVEGDGFKMFMHACCPMFRIPCRSTVRRDVSDVYLGEKQKLKDFFKMKSPRVSLTTDSWISNQQISYMCLTAHFVDDEWNLQKKILNFCPITGHTGNDIGRDVEHCLLDWGISKIMTVTVDNASANKGAIDYLRKKTALMHTNILSGKFMHMRCIAHIINLVVNDGMQMFGKSINKIRAVVKYIRQSPTRLKIFKECVREENLKTKAMLCLDVSTRWNSTYLMLKAACKLERAIDRYQRVDRVLQIELETKFLKGELEPVGLLCDNDWVVITRFMKYLEHFYHLTNRVSGSLYVTSNLFLDEISDISAIINEGLLSDDFDMVQMASRMKEKFDKYWADLQKMNLFIFIAPILDPRYKLRFVLYVIEKMYPSDMAVNFTSLVESAIIDLFNEYMRIYPAVGRSVTQPSNHVDEVDTPRRGLMSMAFKRLKCGQEGNMKTELDRYLKEDLEHGESDFDVLKWWKCNSQRFPIISIMAKDILGIPISTVSSESAFSAGGRVLNDFRSSLTPEIVEALICTQDWTRKSGAPLTIEEDLKELEKIEEELTKKEVDG